MGMTRRTQFSSAENISKILNISMKNTGGNTVPMPQLSTQTMTPQSAPSSSFPRTYQVQSQSPMLGNYQSPMIGNYQQPMIGNYQQPATAPAAPLPLQATPQPAQSFNPQTFANAINTLFPAAAQPNTVQQTPSETALRMARMMAPKAL